MLRCKAVSQLVSESLDRDLPFRQRLAIRLHFMMCKYCFRYKKQLYALKDIIRHQAPTDEEREVGGLSLSSEARDRIKNSLRTKLDQGV